MSQVHPPDQGPPTARLVTSTADGGRSVALTFDDGPDPDTTPWLLDVLREHEVTAVFCLWGEHVVAHPGVVRRVVDEGHVLGNHSLRHDDMEGWSADAVRADLLATNRVIEDAVPGVPVPWFRAPYGRWGVTPQVAAELGMQPLGWRLEVTDWEPPGTDELVRRLEDGLTPGAVVLLHDGGGDRSQTVEAVDRLVPTLRSRGWEFGLPLLRG